MMLRLPSQRAVNNAAPDNAIKSCYLLKCRPGCSFGSMFPVQFASALIAVLTAVAGYYVTSVIEEIRSGPAVVYEIKRESGLAVLSLENVSRDTSIQNLHVGLTCQQDEDSLCFATPITEDGLETTRFAPIAGTLTARQINPKAFEVMVSLVPGAKIQASIPENRANESELIFVHFPSPPSLPPKRGQKDSLTTALIDYLQPPPPAPATPIFLKHSSITALFVKYYFNVMAVSVAISALLLVVLFLGWAFYPAVNRRNKDEEHDQKLSVNLSFIDRQPDERRDG